MNPFHIFPPHFPRIHSIVILPCFLTEMLYALLISPMRATKPAHLHLLELITLIYLVKCTSYEAPQLGVFSFPSFFPLKSKCSETRSICVLLLVWDQVSYPYETTGKILVLCILSFKYLERRRMTKDFKLNGCRRSLSFPNFLTLLQLRRFY